MKQGLLTCLFSLWLLATAGAQTCTTTAAGNWATNTIWSCGTAPSGTFSGTIIIEHNLTITSDITISGKVTIILRNNATLDVRGKTTLLLSNNQSTVSIGAGSSVSGQNANSIITIGTAPTSHSYRMNGAAAISGPDVMTNNGLLSALPVELTYFQATPEGRYVSLSWQTASEQNAARFVVERSRDLGEFLPVGTVEAVGMSQVRQQYGLLDTQPLSGTSYYRLRQLDQDGRSVAGRPVAVQRDETRPTLLVLENPVSGTVVRLNTQGLDGATYQLTDTQGRAIAVTGQAQANGEVTLTLPAQLTGVYVLTACHPGGVVAKRILVR
ncbi:T9SS type A sorting domain-containing protein [Fibrella sp. WM1]|uniref:T9SS type A sorting domain-containing protein n=1 Tax=Fibrella musci TaxID=3242485 RepID=UPI0035224B2B